MNPNAFPRVELPGVDRADVAELGAIHAAAEELQGMKFAALMTLAWHRRTRGPLYLGTVPAHVKAARRKRGKAQRAARKVHR